MSKLVFKEAEELEIKFSTFVGLQNGIVGSQWNSLGHNGIPGNLESIFASLTMLKPFTVWITRNWKILKEMGIPEHLTCLLRNLFAGQEATVRAGHGTIDWFQIGKGVRQGCILSPCLFNLYAE